MNSYRVDLAVNSVQPATAEWRGGKALFISEGTYSGGSVKLQLLSPHGTWIDVPSAEIFDNNMVLVELPQGQVQVVITTATAVYASLIKTGF